MSHVSSAGILRKVTPETFICKVCYRMVSNYLISKENHFVSY